MDLSGIKVLMGKRTWSPIVMTLALGLITCLGRSLSADDGAGPTTPKKWTAQAELNYLATSGNSRSETLGFRNSIARNWRKGRATLEAGAVRAEDSRRSRNAVFLPSGRIEITELTTTELTAESYFIRGQYDREISDHLFWFVGSGWEKNEFAGIDRRISTVGGVGYKWYEKEGEFFKTDIGFTLTDEQNLAGTGRNFSGSRFSWELVERWTETTVFESHLSLDQNLEDSSDARADLTNSMAVAMTARLAVKVSLQLLYDSQPALETIEITTEKGLPTADFIAVELEKLDSVFNASLVVTF